MEANAVRVGDSARRAAAGAPGQLAGEGFRGLRAMFSNADEESLSAERFLLTLVRAVREDRPEDDRDARDVYVTARKRRRRLALLAVGTGPLVGAVNQLADLYCETATVCDVAALHGLELTDEHLSAHMLVLWGIADDHPAALKAMAGDPPVARILTGRLRDSLDEAMPGQLTKWSMTKALWDVRGTVSDARKGATTRAAGTVVLTGHQTKKVIRKAETQLGVAKPTR
ncbi:MAG: hypothetical protein ACTHN7_03625 [Solirubrobacterales bacterium]